MRVSASWLAEHLELGEDVGIDTFPDAFVRLGMEVESVTELGGVRGPVVIGRVAEIEELAGFKKPIRYCRVEVGEDDSGEPLIHGIVCGASNFVEGDLVVTALPGAELPGGFGISARKTYGKTSEGMICSAYELGLGDDHSGILVLEGGFAEPGTDAIEKLELRDTVIELEITPDRGYCLSVRGLTRELACALRLHYGDAAAVDLPAAEGDAWPVTVQDSHRCPRFVMRRVTGVDASAPTPWWMRRRLMLAGIRSISLAVDITNYVMLQTGQPLHAYDAPRLSGGITVRRAEHGEKLTTLDQVERALDQDDLLICDESGAIGLAGVMGGAITEIRSDSSDILLEAAHFEPTSVARTARRHKLPSEASRRFERYVDPAVGPAALELAARLLHRYGDGDIEPGRTEVGDLPQAAAISMPMNLPDRVAGVWYKRGVTAGRLTDVGCRIEVDSAPDGTPLVIATPPSWRNDLTQPADLVEEVLRLEGYDTIPSQLPPAPAGRGLNAGQRRRRTVSRALADSGYVEVMPFPFVDGSVWDAFGLSEQDSRRRTVKLLNPLDAAADELATTLLPGMLEALQRNVSRGNRDLALFGVGQVTQPSAAQPPVPDVPAGIRPSEAQLASLLAALPAQPVHVAAVLTGNRESGGWWGKGRQATWADAVQAARLVGRASGVELTVRAVEHPPWHPGRCAELLVDGLRIGHAGELHPTAIEAIGLPERTVAMELDLDAIPLIERRPAPTVSPYPPVLLDVALVVDVKVAASRVAAALRAGGGELLEELSLFDVYTGDQIAEGKRSMAYSLRFRASDRTLTVEEAAAARDAAVAAAAERYGAALRA
ncbi:MAG: phenylalanine--tRNA ligase subunit beta [Sciscionella sp.]